MFFPELNLFEKKYDRKQIEEISKTDWRELAEQLKKGQRAMWHYSKKDRKNFENKCKYKYL